MWHRYSEVKPEDDGVLALVILPGTVTPVIGFWYGEKLGFEQVDDPDLQACIRNRGLDAAV